MFIVNISPAKAQSAHVHFDSSEANMEIEIQQTIRISADTQDFLTVTAIVVHQDICCGQLKWKPV